jgi:hypothetical protein
MSLKNLIFRLIAAAMGFALATTLYEIIMNVLLRPMTNQIVESQLTNSNSAPTAVTVYFSVANGVLAIFYLALLGFCIYSVIKYKKAQE